MDYGLSEHCSVDIAVLATSLRFPARFHCGRRWPVDVYGKGFCFCLHFLLCPRAELGPDSRTCHIGWNAAEFLGVQRKRFVYACRDHRRMLGHPQRFLPLLAKHWPRSGILQVGRGDTCGMSEPAQSIPMWQTIVALLGLGSWGATWLAYWLNSRLDRRKWINDNKKMEWRESIVEVSGSLEQMSYTFHPANVVSATDIRDNPIAGIQRGTTVLTDRIFIANTLRKHNVLGSWQEIVGYTRLTGSAGQPTPTMAGFNKKAADFLEELLRIAQEDLGIK